MGYSNLITKAVGSVVNDLTGNQRPTVVELGNQKLKNTKARQQLYADLGISPQTPVASTKEFYISLGFARYLAIDVNTERDAVAMDLNVDIVQNYGFTEQFDLVTNNGTSEHVFNQYTVFLNAHNLCRVGGFMIHVLPFYRWVDHGFYNYHPNLFPCLAKQNNYELKQLWIGSSDAEYLEKLNVNKLSRYKGYREDFKLDTWESDPMVVAVMRKTAADRFQSPIQHLYGGDNISTGEISQRYQ